MINLNELARGGTICLTKAGLAIGTTKSKAQIAPSPNGKGVDYAIKGLLYHKDDASVANDAVIQFTGLAQADLTTCLYLVCLDKDGTVSVVQGTAVLSADLCAGNAVLHWPEPAADTCPIGAIKLAMSGGDFIGGTTDLSDASVTDTYYDFCLVPEAPLTS